MRTGFILLTSVVIVLAVLPWARSQGVGSGDSMPGLGPLGPHPDTPLIDDTKGRSGSSHMESVGRYSITVL